MDGNYPHLASWCIVYDPDSLFYSTETTMNNEVCGRWEGQKEVFLGDGPEADIMSTTNLVVGLVAGNFLRFSYEWQHDGEAKIGLLLVGREPDKGEATGAWMDSWHQSRQIMALSGEIEDTGRIDLKGSYKAPPGPDWGWRIGIASESRDELAITMNNIFPDGKEVLGVRAVYQRVA